MILLAIDPGNEAGWSAWYSRVGGAYELLACGCGVPDGHMDLLGRGLPSVVLSEIPRVNEGVDPQRIITLAMNAGRRVQAAPRMIGAPVYGVLPRTWKGTLDKVRHHRAIKAELLGQHPASFSVAAEAEKKVRASLAHNMWDAVGLGLWGVKRIAQLKTFSDYVFPELV